MPILVDGGKACILEDEAVVAPGGVAVVHHVLVQNPLQKLRRNPAERESDRKKKFSSEGDI